MSEDGMAALIEMRNLTMRHLIWREREATRLRKKLGESLGKRTSRTTKEGGEAGPESTRRIG